MKDRERLEKFTPGPWKAHTTLNADWVMTDWSDCEEQENICDLSHSNGGNDVYLIAAAPEMFNKLAELENALRPDIPRLADDIAEVLRKARGLE